MSQASVNCDVLIVGGGLVGLSLANALSQVAVSCVLVEARNPNLLQQQSFDGRVTALANGSKGILEQLGLWGHLREHAVGIHSVHIGEQGRFGAARINAADEGVDVLGYTLENRVLGKVLWQEVANHPRFNCIAPAKLISFSADTDAIVATIERDDKTCSVAAKLMIAADGANSFVRRALGISAREDDYGQQALIVNCTTEMEHKGRAFERFTKHGPLAVLPLSAGRSSIVWTLEHPDASRIMALGDDQFRYELQRSFGYRLGKFRRVGSRDLHTLRRVRSDALSDTRTLLIGNAALSVHPVAGQGFNLALRDVATITEIIADEISREPQQGDIGAARVLNRYGQWRAYDQRTVAWFTHGLIRCFGMTLPGLGILRGLGLAAFDLAPGAKRLLARHTMGMSGHLPRLARGLGLS